MDGARPFAAPNSSRNPVAGRPSGGPWRARWEISATPRRIASAAPPRTPRDARTWVTSGRRWSRSVNDTPASADPTGGYATASRSSPKAATRSGSWYRAWSPLGFGSIHTSAPARSSGWRPIVARGRRNAVR